MGATRSARRGVVSVVAMGLFAVPVVPTAAESVEGRVAAVKVSEETYRHYLDDMLYTHVGDDRSITGPEHELARDNIETLLNSFGLTVTLESFTYDFPEPGTVYYNVVGTKLGTAYPDQEYILGAHYDSWTLPDSGPAPGADDNASGVALVLEAARVLSAYDSDYTIRFIAFDLEEWEHSGSRAYVDDHIGDDILGMIAADMVARNARENIVDILCTQPSAPLRSTLAQAVDTYGDGLAYVFRPDWPASDHWSFEKAGFDACLLIEDDHEGNPFFHTPRDNVDEPDYLDYAYAIRATRSAVGFLVDHAGVHVDIPDADYDEDGVVDGDDFNAFSLCFTGPDTPPVDPDCYFFDFESDGDIDCAEWDLFVAVWPGPDDPPMFPACDPVPPAAVADGGRYLAVTPPEGAPSLALLFTGDPGDPAVSCMSLYVQADGSLAATPFFQTAAEWGTVQITGENIVPETSYELYCDYGEPGAPVLSPAATVTTRIWGDTVGEFTELGWTPADGAVRILDIVAIVDKFRDLPTAPPIEWVDLIGLGGSGVECAPDQRIDIIDAVGAVDAFGGKTYWESMLCPQPCQE